MLSLPIVVIIAVVVGGLIWKNQQPAAATGPVTVSSIDAPGATGRYCKQLMTALPDSLGTSAKRQLVGDLAGTAAWGDPAIVLRCGLPTPSELTCSSALTQVSNANGQPGVQWLQLSDSGQTTYLAADRSVRIAITLPDGTGTGPIQQMSAVISGIMPARAICSNGTLLPTDDK